MERTFTVEEKKAALEFAYSMGLKDGAKNLSYRVTLRKHPA